MTSNFPSAVMWLVDELFDENFSSKLQSWRYSKAGKVRYRLPPRVKNKEILNFSFYCDTPTV